MKGLIIFGFKAWRQLPLSKATLINTLVWRMKIIFSPKIALRVAVAVVSIMGCTLQAQQFPQPKGWSSTGGGKSANAANTQVLWSVVGQPVTLITPTRTQTQAGFMQVGTYIIPDVTKPVIEYTTPLANIIPGQTNSIEVKITDDYDVISTAFLWKRKITAAAATYDSVALNSGANNTYSKNIDASWFDPIGMEFYFTAKDQAGNLRKGPVNHVYVKNTSLVVPRGYGFGETVDKYRVFSMPYTLPNKQATSIFDEVSEDTSPNNFKIGSYTGSGYEDAPTQQIERGKGYWVLIKKLNAGTTSVEIENAEAPRVHRSALFEMDLKTGWNLIGNPYPVDISWNDVVAFSGNTGAPSNLKTWNGTYADGDILQPFQGGWVKATSNVTLRIPFRNQAALGGRTTDNEMPKLDEPDWKIKLAVQQSGLGNELAAIGMNESASDGLDAFDDFNPPAIGGSPELNFNNEWIEEPLAKDITAPKQEAVWKFQANGNVDEPVTITWPSFQAGDKELFLVDEAALTIADMTRESSYVFTLRPSHKFKIYFGKNMFEKIQPTEVALVSPFPNPVSAGQSIVFRLGLPQRIDEWQIKADLVSVTGNVIAEGASTVSAGFTEFSFNLNNNAAAGFYIYRVNASSGNFQKSFTGKIIVR